MTLTDDLDCLVVPGCHGVVTAAALRDAGISNRSATTRVDRGHLVQAAYGIYVVARYQDQWTPIVVAQRRWTSSVLGGRSALLLYDCDAAASRPTTRDLIRLAPGSRAPFACGTGLEAGDTEVIDGVNVIRPVPLLVRMAASVPADDVEAALESFLHHRDVTEADVEAGLLQAPGRRGEGLRTVIARRGLGIPPTESLLETRTVQWVLRPAGLVHERQVEISLGNTYLKRFDFRLASGLLVNCHGMAFHTSKAAVQQDAAYGLRLRLAGLSVETITWDDVVRRPNKTARDLTARSYQVANGVHA